MAAINSIQPLSVAACNNRQGTETVLSDTHGCTNVVQNHLNATETNATDNDNHGSLDDTSVQTHLSSSAGEGTEQHEVDNSQGVIDIHINNVVCTFNLRCHINLKRLAMEGANVEYRRSHGKTNAIQEIKRSNAICNMKLRRPHVTANVTSSGKVTVTGSTSEVEAKVAARRVARRLQKLGFNVRFCNFRVVNVLGTCSLPFGIKLNIFSNEHPQSASYEPELHPGVTYKVKEPKATLKIFSTGSITITAPCVDNIGLAVEHIYPLVSEFQTEKRETPQNKKFKNRSYQQNLHRHAAVNGFHDDEDEDEEEYFGNYVEEASDFDSEEEDFDSDVSHD